MEVTNSTHLEMRTGDGLGQLIEQRLLHLGELPWVHDFEDVLNLIEIHDLLGAVGLRPEAQQSKYNLYSNEYWGISKRGGD